MKSLKTILIVFLLLQTAVSFGQTKEETELWINQKVQKYSGKWIDRYVGDGALYYHFSTTDFQLKDGMLVVKTGFKYTSNYSDEGLQLLQNKTTTKMNILYFLIGCSVLVALVFLGAFFWALKNGQHDDVYTPGVRILFDDEVKSDKSDKNHISD